MEVDVVSAEERLYQGEATALYARSTDGEIGILPGHQPILLALVPAPVKVQGPDGERIWAVSGGFLSFRDNRLTVIADDARPASSAEEAYELARGA